MGNHATKLASPAAQRYLEVVVLVSLWFGCLVIAFNIRCQHIRLRCFDIYWPCTGNTRQAPHGAESGGHEKNWRSSAYDDINNGAAYKGESDLVNIFKRKRRWMLTYDNWRTKLNFTYVKRVKRWTLTKIWYDSWAGIVRFWGPWIIDTKHLPSLNKTAATPERDDHAAQRLSKGENRYSSYTLTFFLKFVHSQNDTHCMGWSGYDHHY